ncbi:purine-cytosine permease family protein [Burkholderia cenocepacia]|jgi:nucleobase:cation symporter-1, NCS1 family|uniref:Cytosine permease n=4 Tax=Burkholderia cepacia complex TaxID=87882 RepID=A0ABD4USB8_9BURK|nr:cytosine permease [Burkholderia cenocepacia]MCW3701289.1 cytosine permease [Burkholderia cenocepacia]MCW3709267.1 cytosine permease [Burkholderia cenocepacia]MCW3717318.1 cytosine permease [Burkholderia cenocepacia]MCW3725341.1 cytosine permease [Burkholderia cenocepacia]MCW3733298.1 cytosine permease [Burkholderia cenocepacia]
MTKTTAIERRSIDFIPPEERHGSPRSLFFVWFAANTSITAVVTGALFVILGNSALWSIPAIVLGNAVGGFFTSLHSAQGPKLGVPQMIQSRAQFGYYGAILPLVLALMIYVGFYATGLVLGGQAMSALFHIPPQAGAVVFALMSTALAIVGYRYIHRFSRVAAVLSGVAFAILLVRIIADGNMPIPIATHGFAAAPFALGISISASWKLTFGPYIADYSRYLPAETSTRATIGWTFLGSVLGGSVAMILGALAAALGGAAFSNDQVGYLAALGGAIWPLVLLAVICGKLTGNTLSSYGGCMSLTTIVTSLTGQDRVSPRQRAAFVCIISAIALGIALAASRNFLSNFTNFLLFLLYFMTPWSAINLVDYYWVRRERYKVAQFFAKDGEYGLVRIGAFVAYFFGVLIQIPFMNSSLYVGPIAHLLGGAEIAWVIGLAVAGGLYYASTGSIRRVMAATSANQGI